MPRHSTTYTSNASPVASDRIDSELLIIHRTKYFKNFSWELLSESVYRRACVSFAELGSQLLSLVFSSSWATRLTRGVQEFVTDQE